MLGFCKGSELWTSIVKVVYDGIVIVYGSLKRCVQNSRLTPSGVTSGDLKDSAE